MECSTLLALIGQRIRFLRKRAGLSQEALSELAGIHPTSLSDLERGKVNGFVCNYFNLASALGVSLADLVDTASDVGDVQTWREMRSLMDQIKRLDSKRQAVYLDAAKKLLERVESI